MKSINLIDINKSDIKYVLSTFPDGEPHLKINEIDRKESYQVICRISNPNELFILMQVGDILNRQGVVYDIVISYLMSMRMDRVVSFNESFSLKVVADIINGLKPRKVYIYEAHSNRTFDLINNSEPYNPNFLASMGHQFAVCYPDHGAYERYCKGNNRQCIVMNKVRDLENNGKIISLEIEKEPDILEEPVIMIQDDLCDSGGTFCWAAKVLRERYPAKKLIISVKHLVNPVGLKNLAENFDEVYITNSYRDWDTSQYDNVVMWKIF